MKVAYLTSRYPSVSHTFIMREIQALRESGTEVDTFTIRRPPESELLTEADRTEFRRTFTVLPVSFARLFGSHVTMLLARPGCYFGALWKALRIRPPGVRAALWHLFYFCEAGVLAARLRRRGIRHVHAHFANVASNVAMLAIRMIGGRWSITLHGLSDFQDPRSVCLADKIKDAAFVICVSDFGRAQAMLHTQPHSWSKIHRVRCGVDTRRYVPPTKPRAGDSNRVRVLNVARMGPEKAHPVLLEAVKRAVERGVDIHCTLVGDGPRREDVKRLAHDLGISDQVTFAGAVGQEEIHKYYHDADLFVLPSFAEGLPVVLMEAMATELPVITTAIMGVPELVKHEVNGLLVPPGCAEPLAEAIIDLASDSEKRRRLGSMGREKVCQEFEIGRNVMQLSELFAAVLSPAGGCAERVPSVPAVSTVSP